MAQDITLPLVPDASAPEDAAPVSAFRNDRLFVFVRRRMRWTPFAVAFLLGPLKLIPDLLLPVLLGVPQDLNLIVSSLIQSLVIVPLGLYLYLALPGAFFGMFHSLQQGKAVGELREPGQAGPVAYRAFLNAFTAAMDSRIIIALGLFAAVLYCVYRLFLPVPGDVTLAIPEPYRLFNRVLLLMIYSPAQYGAIVTLGRLLVTLFYTGRLFRSFHIRANPLSPDQSGGLGAMGNMLAGSVLIATGLGAASAVVIITQYAMIGQVLLRAETILMGLIYLIFTPLLFLYWLWAPHQALLRARESQLQPLADEFIQALASPPDPSQASSQAMKERTERLTEIKRQYDFLLSTFPTWPLPDAAVKRLVATASLPTLSSLASGLLSSLGQTILGLFQR